MTKTKRNYGIDLLRIFSMLLIVVLHLLKQGGILNSVEQGTAGYHLAWLAEIIACCAVNCYGLISGYVNVDNKIKYHKLGIMWLQVVFYCFFITLIYYFQFKESFKFYHWTDNFFPVCTKQYWYFTAYVPLFLFMPYLNKLINSLTQTKLKKLGILIFIVFPVTQTVWQTNVFVGGYTFPWLLLLYILGAIIKKLDLVQKLSWQRWTLIFTTAAAVSYIFKISAEATNAAVNKDILMSYYSVTTVVQGISLLAIGINLDIKKKTAVKLISFFSPLSFGVYLIHTNTWIFNNLIKNCAVSLTQLPAPLMLLSVIGIAAAIFVACCLIDYLRMLLFRALKITPALKKAEAKIMNKLNHSSYSCIENEEQTTTFV